MPKNMLDALSVSGDTDGGDGLSVTLTCGAASSKVAIPTIGGVKARFVYVHSEGEATTNWAMIVVGDDNAAADDVVAVVATAMQLPHGVPVILDVTGSSHIAGIRNGAADVDVQITPLANQ